MGTVDAVTTVGLLHVWGDYFLLGNGLERDLADSDLLEGVDGEGVFDEVIWRIFILPINHRFLSLRLETTNLPDHNDILILLLRRLEY